MNIKLDLISVKHRLPEENEVCLVVTDGDDALCVAVHDGEDWIDWRYQLVPGDDCEIVRFVSGEVTHWIDLDYNPLLKEK